MNDELYLGRSSKSLSEDKLTLVRLRLATNPNHQSTGHFIAFACNLRNPLHILQILLRVRSRQGWGEHAQRSSRLPSPQRTTTQRCTVTSSR